MNNIFMDLAIKEAEKAYKLSEIPVGCVIVCNNKILSKAHNLVEKKKNCLYHAEILAISKASKKIKNWRLNNCEMYVTLEPCLMCKEAIKHSRIKKVYYILNNNNQSTNISNIYVNDKYMYNITKKMFKNFFDSLR